MLHLKSQSMHRWTPATLAGILVDRGVLRWETTLSQLFPELRTSMRTEYLNVTIEQLLQHRGRIVADEDASAALAEKVAAYEGPASQSRLALFLLSHFVSPFVCHSTSRGIQVLRSHFSLLIVSTLLGHVAFGHEPHGPRTAASKNRPHTHAQGFVFHDANGNRRKPRRWLLTCSTVPRSPRFA
jgi:hypothetical protein